MKIQDIVSDMRSRIETAGKQYQGVFKAYFDTQRKAFTVVSRNGQTLANTEIGAAKNVFAAAKASFDKARRDGLRKIANNPQAYVPNGRAQVVSAYKDSIGLLVKTGNELGDVVTDGYKTVVGRFSPNTTASAKTTTSKTKTATAPRSKAPARKTAAKRSTSTRKSTGSAAKSAGTQKTSRTSTADKSAKTKTTPTKRRTKTSTTKQSDSASSASGASAAATSKDAGSQTTS